mmetsp:Transcript_40512/g.94797  ORF Transcript_40512/g.94797 Transcript_40512/m.94797 type:complete len:97 (+) Transcript_40512:309-599(+)
MSSGACRQVLSMSCARGVTYGSRPKGFLASVGEEAKERVTQAVTLLREVDKLRGSGQAESCIEQLKSVLDAAGSSSTSSDLPEAMAWLQVSHGREK